MIDHMFMHDRCALWAGMGTGKTSACLYFLTVLKLIETVSTLVIAPWRVANDVWPAEIAKWDTFSDLSISCILGTPKKRLQALSTDADIYTINYENIPWLICELNGQDKFNTIIADESTRLKSFRIKQGGKRTKALSKIAFKNVTRFIELTGTPSPNGLQDLWGQFWFLDKGERLGRTYTAFDTRWFNTRSIGNFIKRTPTIFAQPEIEQRVKDISLTIKGEDWFDLKKPVVVDVPVYLSKTAMEMYKKMEREMFIEIAQYEVEAFNIAAKTMKCLQLANGAVYVDKQQTWIAAHDAKLDTLESIVSEANGMPVLVAYHFKSDLARLLKRFPKGEELTKKPGVMKRWNKGEIPILFAHPASAGHGLNLQDGGNILAIFGHWWDLEQYQQIVERIGPVRQAQSGYNRPVYIYHIIAAGTIDETIVARRENKREIQDLLLESAKRIKYKNSTDE